MSCFNQEFDSLKPGLAEDVLDHRHNTRTVYMNPIFRFLYWNMNYHVEHHMFPMVPYHALPALHEEMKADTAPVYRNMMEAYREIIPALWKQSSDPDFFVPRAVPNSDPISEKSGSVVAAWNGLERFFNYYCWEMIF